MVAGSATIKTAAPMLSETTHRTEVAAAGKIMLMLWIRVRSGCCPRPRRNLAQQRLGDDASEEKILAEGHDNSENVAKTIVCRVFLTDSDVIDIRR